ncbi:hypothetical protein [Wielerella bovis]|nr:hypothetical protein [Wielerella bovis]
MNEQDDLDFDNLDNLFEQFDGMVIEGGIDAAQEDDNCVGGACKI